jgi:hypothetical protein
MDARLLSPNPECFRLSPSVACRCHAVTASLAMSIDDAMSRKEILRLAWRLEALHLPLSSTRRSM